MDTTQLFALAPPGDSAPGSGLCVLVHRLRSARTSSAIIRSVACCSLGTLVVVGPGAQWSQGVAGHHLRWLVRGGRAVALLKLPPWWLRRHPDYGRDYAEQRATCLTAAASSTSLTLMALLGQMIMISANSMLTAYLGVELMSFALYALVALRREHRQSIEAALKYFVLGAHAPACCSYGMSMLYGATRSPGADAHRRRHQLGQGRASGPGLRRASLWLPVWLSN